MANFSKEIPLNPDASLGPVTIGSKITVERGTPPLPIERGTVELIPGCRWDKNTVRVTPTLDPKGTKLNILIEIPDGIPLSHYVNVIRKRIPVRLNVTLFPKIGIPGMGIPVSVSAAPVMDTVEVTIPEIPPPAITIQAEFIERMQDGTSRVRVSATLQIPPYIDSTERDAALQMLSLVPKSTVNARVQQHDLVPVENGKSCLLDVSPTELGDPGKVTMASEVSLSSVPVYAERMLSFELARTFILNIDPIVLNVTMKKTGSFTVQVLEELPDGRNEVIPGASIVVTGDSDLITATPMQGEGRMVCTITQNKVTSIKSVDLTITATVEQDSVFSRTLTVHPETRFNGTLDVKFKPASKTSVNPFIDGDRVVLVARLISQDGIPIDDANITFASPKPGRWLEGPREYAVAEDPNDPLSSPSGGSIALPLDAPDITQAVRTRDAGKAAVFVGRNPSPGMTQTPPGSESVSIRATLQGELVDEKTIPVLLLPKPALISDKETITLLANARNERKGRPKAIMAADILLSVVHPGNRQWTISVDYAERNLLSVNEKEETTSSKIFEFEIGDNVPVRPEHPDKVPWIQTVKVKTLAVLDGLSIEGPTLSVSLCHEGIYLESLFEYDRDGKEREVTDRKAITYHILDPSEDRALEPINVLKTTLSFPFATFAVMEWNGTDLVRNEHLAIEVQKDENYQVAQHSRDPDRMARHIWDFIFFTLKESAIEVRHEGESDRNTGKWHLLILKQLPGKGEKASGFIRFVVSPPDYYFFAAHDATKNWQYELPISLVLGTPPPPLVPGVVGTGGTPSSLAEGARCRKIIDECFPEQHREGLWRELEAIPFKGPDDYRCFSEKILKLAHEIWAQEQEDYLAAEKRWTDLIDYAQKAEFAGDLAFGSLVMFYTAGLGPFANFAVSNLVTTIQSESKAVYSYYVLQGRGRDFPACIRDYVAENWARYLTDLASGEIVEPWLQREFELQKIVTEPRKFGKILTWLWLWKFQLHLAKGIGKEDGGIINSAYKATTDIGTFLLTVTLAEVIKSHGNTRLEDINLRDLYNKARKKGYFGGTATESEPKTAKPKKSSARSADQNARDAFIRGRDAGRAKVEALTRAAEDLTRNPGDPDLLRRFGNAAEAVQGDKHAMHALNERNPNQQDPLRQQFNDFWKGEYAAVDRATRQRIADQLNTQLKPGDTPYTVDDIGVAGVTNTPPKSPAEDSVKSTYDRDVTYRDNRTGKDIKTGVSRDIYNDEFYRQRHNGELPMKNEGGRQVVDRDAVNTFAEHCDQTVTDRYHPDAYGGGPEDIGPAVDPKQKGVPFKDVEATAKAMEYKVEEWYNRAQKAELAGDHIAAEGYKEEGMRQLTKQFKNQVQGRVDKINEITGSPDSSVARVPDDLKAAVDVMNRVGTTGPDGTIFTPADAEAALSAMNTSPKDVASKMSGVVESLQKNAPPEVLKAVEDHVKTLTE